MVNRLCCRKGLYFTQRFHVTPLPTPLKAFTRSSASTLRVKTFGEIWEDSPHVYTVACVVWWEEKRWVVGCGWHERRRGAGDKSLVSFSWILHQSDLMCYLEFLPWPLSQAPDLGHLSSAGHFSLHKHIKRPKCPAVLKPWSTVIPIKVYPTYLTPPVGRPQSTS